VSTLSLSDVPLDRLEQFDKGWTAYETAVRNGCQPLLENVLAGMAGPYYRVLLLHALRMEWELRQSLGQPVTLQDYLGRFGDDLVNEAFAEERTVPHVPAAKPQRLPHVSGYEILEELGRGGMGVVYKARHLALKRLVALKMIGAGSPSPEELHRFRTEAEAVALLKVPGIVQIHDFGTHDDRPFFSMEFCEGGNLAAKLAGKPLPPREAVQLVEQVARAVQAAHDKGIVHRDLKPGNVLLTPAEQEPDDSSGPVCRLGKKWYVPKISDFGLAKRLDAEAVHTRTGEVLGSLPYMAPEQAQGRSKDVGRAADVYALGATLYECLTGRPPFKAANTVDTIFQVVSELPVSPWQLNPVVDRSLASVCLKCLEKKPKDRYPTAAALATDLKRWIDGEPIEVEPWWRWLWRQFQSPCRIDRPREWARVFWYLAAWRVICHGGMALLLQSGPAPAAYWAWFIGLHVGTWLPVWWLLHSERRLDTIERGMLLNWGATFACDAILFALFCPLWGQVRPEEVVRVYAAWPAAHGLWYVAEGRRSWGQFYAVGLGYFVAAPLLSLCGLLAPVAYALVVACALLWLGDGFRRLANQQASDRRAAQQAAGALPPSSGGRV
jgi:hypothetical protein